MNADPVSLIVIMAVLALAPLAIATMTSFLKIAVVLSLVRNALGVQQAPPNMVLYALALMLSMFIMAPVGNEMARVIESNPQALQTPAGLIATAKAGAEPLRRFLLNNSDPRQRNFFIDQARRIWPPEMSAGVAQDHLAILVPAFVVTELTAAFEIGFLLFLPFVVIDLVISNILMAMGMMMMSPVTISLPLKLFLFVMVDGWTRLLQGLILTYRY
ncbi:type III secretion system export apparatus subunit SctR [uncultured Hydrogenophaga sp.]|uniref:type III secretion system export apparatus subunit SctR n=1 Tax=uncultured Hydrogenophaga sp. TaxID=199683 RepID=UPI00265EFD6A|nr:type III secretion system export apparatus subunit SctR [uncultured Hydrogenophaga sp.]